MAASELRDYSADFCNSLGVIPPKSIVNVTPSGNGNFLNNDYLFVNYDGDLCELFDAENGVCKHWSEESGSSGWVAREAIVLDLNLDEYKPQIATPAVDYAPVEPVQTVQESPKSTDIPVNNQTSPTPFIDDSTKSKIIGRKLTLRANANVRKCAAAKCNSLGVITVGSKVVISQDPKGEFLYDNKWIFVNYEGNFCSQYDKNSDICRRWAHGKLAGWVHMGLLSDAP